MNLALIRTFLAIVETGSLVKASRQLHITQSTVTSRLKTLEAEVGQPLLHRHKSGISLTAAGLKFSHYAQAMQNLWQQALLETSLPVGMDVACHLACEPCLWPTLARRLCSEIRSVHPSTALTIKTGSAKQIDDWLATGLVEAALGYRPSSLASFSSVSIGVERLAVYSTRADGPLHHDPDYTYYDAGSEFGRSHAETYTDAGVAKNSFDNALWCLEHILDCGGSAYLPQRLAEPYVERGQLFQLAAGKIFTRPIYLTSHDVAIAGWPWLPDLARQLQSAG